MKRAFVFLLLVVLSVVLVGCGGGGGGGGSSPGGDTGTLVVKLIDSSNLPVDGIVTVGSSSQATLNGEVTFASLTTGTRSVRAEVNGISTSKSITVVADVVTTASITIASPTPSPGPTSGPPPGPF